jgi:hypothetical protein
MKLYSAIQLHETATTDSHGDIEAREIEGVLDVVNEDDDFLRLMEMTGRMVPTTNKEYFNIVNGFLYKKAVVATSGGSTITAGNNGVVTVEAGHQVRAGEYAMLGDGGYGYVYGVAGNVLSIHAITAFTTSNAEEIAFPTNGIDEGGSGTIKPESPLTRKKNHTQIFETKDEVSDLGKAGKTVVKFGNGETGYFYKLESEVYRKHRGDIANAAFVSKFAKFAHPTTGKDVYSTRGIDSSIVDDGGVNHTAAGSQTFAKTDLENFSRLLDIARAPKKGMLPVGQVLNNKIENAFHGTGILASGNIDYGVFGKGSNKQKFVDLGVNGFSAYGREWYKTVVSALDHPEVTGIAGMKWNQRGYFLPTDKVKGLDGSMQDRIRMRYLQIDGINSRWHVKYLGGLAPTPNADSNTFKIVVTSWEGVEVLGSSQMGRIQLGA